MTTRLSFASVRGLEARAVSPRPNRREHLIAIGAIREPDPDELSRTPPLDHCAVLRLDDAGREAMRRAIEQRSRTRRARP